MNIEVTEQDGIKILRLSGELTDAAESLVVETASAALPGRGARAVIDLSGVPYVNSVGLSALVRINAQANVQEQRVKFAAPAPAVANIFVATRLDRFFDVRESVDEAIAALHD